MTGRRGGGRRRDPKGLQEKRRNLTDRRRIMREREKKPPILFRELDFKTSSESINQSIEMEESGSLQRNEFLLPSKGNCFLCLRTKRKLVKYSYRRISSHLNISLGKVISSSFESSKLSQETVALMEKADVKVELCDECALVTEAFSGLHEKMEILRIQVTSVLERVASMIREHPLHKYHRNKLRLAIGRVHMRIFDSLRNETLKKYQNAANWHSFPIVAIKKLKVEDEQVEGVYLSEAKQVVEKFLPRIAPLSKMPYMAIVNCPVCKKEMQRRFLPSHMTRVHGGKAKGTCMPSQDNDDNKATDLPGVGKKIKSRICPYCFQSLTNMSLGKHKKLFCMMFKRRGSFSQRKKLITKGKEDNCPPVIYPDPTPIPVTLESLLYPDVKIEDEIIPDNKTKADSNSSYMTPSPKGRKSVDNSKFGNSMSKPGSSSVSWKRKFDFLGVPKVSNKDSATTSVKVNHEEASEDSTPKKKPSATPSPPVLKKQTLSDFGEKRPRPGPASKKAAWLKKQNSISEKSPSPPVLIQQEAISSTSVAGTTGRLLPLSSGSDIDKQLTKPTKSDSVTATSATTSPLGALKTVFLCVICDREFPDEAAYQQHNDSKHVRYKCEFCDEQFDQLSTLKRHFMSTHNFQESTT